MEGLEFKMEVRKIGCNIICNLFCEGPLVSLGDYIGHTDVAGDCEGAERLLKPHGKSLRELRTCSHFREPVLQVCVCDTETHYWEGVIR